MDPFQQNTSPIILFLGFFVLYGLEFFFPLVEKKGNHFWTNVSLAAVLSLVNIAFTSFTLWVADWVAVNEIGLFHIVEFPIVLQAVAALFFLDFWAGYVVHLIFHKFRFFWKFHSVHHSDGFVDVTTTFRQHPVESVVRILFHVAGMMMLGIPAWMLFLYLTISTIHAQFEHANIQLPSRVDRLLQYLIVTPNMHKVHHSRYQHETDSNYSNIFSIWDRLFGTLIIKQHYDAIDYGLDYLEKNKTYSFWELLKLPFEKKRKEA